MSCALCSWLWWEVAELGCEFRWWCSSIGSSNPLIMTPWWCSVSLDSVTAISTEADFKREATLLPDECLSAQGPSIPPPSVRGRPKAHFRKLHLSCKTLGQSETSALKAYDSYISFMSLLEKWTTVHDLLYFKLANNKSIKPGFPPEKLVSNHSLLTNLSIN